MYDIVRLFKRIFHKFPPKFWLAILGILSLFFLCGPITDTITNLIAPPAPTATPRPTPDVRQNGTSGTPIRVLDSFISVLGFAEFDHNCDELTESTHTESTKGIIIELWIRHLGEEPARFSNFFLVDEAGTNYILQAGEKIARQQNSCLDSLSAAVNRASTNFTITEGYGSHLYLYSFDIPSETENIKLSFQMNYRILYEADATVTEGTSKIFIDLQNNDLFAKPDKALLGPPTRHNLSMDRTTMIGDTAFAISETNRTAGDNGNTYFYLELFANNTSNLMQEIRYESDIEFSVVDAYGVVLPAGLSMNTGYNHSVAPGETQKYYLTWQMEQKSISQQYIYLRILWKNQDPQYYFIQIPFKKSMLIPTIVLDLAPVPTSATENNPLEVAEPTTIPQCQNTLPPRLSAGDTAMVTYSPPVANRLRKEAGYKGQIITVIEPGNAFYVMDGPVCQDELYWYYVNFNGYYGWTAESDKGQYWLEKR